MECFFTVILYKLIIFLFLIIFILIEYISFFILFYIGKIFVNFAPFYNIEYFLKIKNVETQLKNLKKNVN